MIYISKRRKNKRICYLDFMIKWVTDYIEKENPIMRLTIASYKKWLSVLEIERYNLKEVYDIRKSE